MVRLPVSPAKWSTWKRYCGAAGISMGRAIVALMDRELASVAEMSVTILRCWRTEYVSSWPTERLKLRIGNELICRRGKAAW